jgi:hypothetical protein
MPLATLSAIRSRRIPARMLFSVPLPSVQTLPAVRAGARLELAIDQINSGADAPIQDRAKGRIKRTAGAGGKGRTRPTDSDWSAWVV